MHITQKATIHNVCVDAPSNHPATCKNSYAHDKKMGAHYYERPDVPSSDSSGWKPSYTSHIKKDALHYECVGESSILSAI